MSTVLISLRDTRENPVEFQADFSPGNNNFSLNVPSFIVARIYFAIKFQIKTSHQSKGSLADTFSLVFYQGKIVDDNRARSHTHRFHGWRYVGDKQRGGASKFR